MQDAREQMSNGRLFQNLGPIKEEDFSPNVFLLVDGIQIMKLSNDLQSRLESLYLCSDSDRYLGPPSEREQ